MRAKKLGAIGIVVLGLSFAAGCSEESSPKSAGSASSTSNSTTAGAPEAGVIKGTAMTEGGKPVPSFGGSVYGFSLKSGQNVTANFDGKDGVYKANVGPGQFATRAWTDVEYNGHKYRLDLDPADGKGGLAKQDTTDGVVKNFVWKLGGFRAGLDERSDDRYYGHHGGSVMLSAEGLDTTYQGDILRNYGGKAEPALAKDSTIELTLTPDGPLIDGSEGKPVVFAVKMGAVKDWMERLKRGIPIGKYKASAVEITAAGERKPLRVVEYEKFHKRDPRGPAASLDVLFIQSNAPSENVNGVDELSLHVLY